MEGVAHTEYDQLWQYSSFHDCSPMTFCDRMDRDSENHHKREVGILVALLKQRCNTKTDLCYTLHIAAHTSS